MFFIVVKQIIVCIFALNIKTNTMTITKLSKGTYKVIDAQGTWIARGGEATVNGMWTANDCDNVDDLSSENNWAVEFKTFAQLKKYSQSF